MIGKSGLGMFPSGKSGNAMPLSLLGMLGPMVAGWAAYEGGRIGHELGKRKKEMESNRMKRTADAKAMSKKNLVLAFVELGRHFDESANVISDLRAEVATQKKALDINISELSKRTLMESKLLRAYDEIRKMRKLLAHYLESEVGA